MRKILLGDALLGSSRSQLIEWLVASVTGGKRLRAGLPKGWRVGDKSGTGANNETNDIAIVWPPGRAPIIATAYYAKSRAPADERESVLANVGRLVSQF